MAQTMTITYNGTEIYSGSGETVTLPTGGKWLTNDVVMTLAGPSLEDTSWADISAIGAAGNGADYFAIGDTKSVTLNGTVGIKTYSNATKKMFIAHFNYKGQNGVYLMGFKDASTGNVLGMCDSNHGVARRNGTKTFNMNHWGGSSSPYNTNYGGWKGCDMRYDIFGSTNVAPSGYGSTKTTSCTGNDPSNYDIVNSPVANTLMAALESGLRQYMKSFTVYTDNTGNASTAAANVTASVDYIVLPAEYEVYGATNSIANENEAAQQEQLEYYALGNSKITYDEDAATTEVIRFLRSPRRNVFHFALCYADGDVSSRDSSTSCALTPLLRVA